LTSRLAVGSKLLQIGPAAALNSNATGASVAIIAAVTDFFVMIFIAGTAPMMATDATKASNSSSCLFGIGVQRRVAKRATRRPDT